MDAEQKVTEFNEVINQKIEGNLKIKTENTELAETNN